MQKILDGQGKTLSLKTGFSFATRVSDVLENVQNNKCIQADMESPNLLPAFGKDNENEKTCPCMQTGQTPETQGRSQKGRRRRQRVEAPALARTRI
ncbi:hypothetical protein MTO96_034836 [Rhipicephalus appendiculatus]